MGAAEQEVFVDPKLPSPILENWVRGEPGGL